MLTPQGVAELGPVLERLKAQGQGVIFITHKLHEALTLGDGISILRQGRIAGSIDRAQARARPRTTSCGTEIVHLMFGAEADTVAAMAELQDELVAERIADGSGATRGERRGAARARDVTAEGERTELGIDERLARPARGRDPRHRRRRRQRPARARRGDRRTAAARHAATSCSSAAP